MDNPNPPESSGSNPLEGSSSRRSFLRSTAAALSGGAAAIMARKVGDPFLDVQPVLAQTRLSPDEALNQLLAGNRRFAFGKTTAHESDLEILKKNLMSKQEPFAGVLACADSRIPVEMVFDQTIGQVFVTRVAGNMITPEIVGSLEYGVAVLGLKVIMVLGHSDCGAIRAAIAGNPVPGQISTLFPHLQPAVDQAGPEAMAVTKMNAKMQARLLQEASTVVAAKIKERQLLVVPGYYDIGTGVVSQLEA